MEFEMNNLSCDKLYSSKHTRLAQKYKLILNTVYLICNFYAYLLLCDKGVMSGIWKR